jgi:hypothetical protein
MKMALRVIIRIGLFLLSAYPYYTEPLAKLFLTEKSEGI